MNDELNGNVWLNQLRAEEAVAAPRPDFKAELRARIGAEWDGAAVATDTQAPPQTQAMPVTEAPPVRSIPAARTDTGGPSSPGGPRSPGSSTFSWPRLAAAAAIVAVFAGGFVLLSQRGNDDVVVTNTVPSTPVSIVTLPETTAPVTTVTGSTTAPASTGPVPSSTAAPSTTSATAAPQTSSTPPTTSTTAAPFGTAPKTPTQSTAPKTTTAPTPPPSKPGVPVLLDQFPFKNGDPSPSVDKFQHYMPAKPLPGETEVQKSGASDEAIADGQPVFVQAYRIGEAMVTIVTDSQDTPREVAQPTGEDINTSGWANQWPTAYYAVAPSGAIRIVVGNGDGSVVVTAVGLDKVNATQFVAGLTRRPTPQAGWDPATPATSQAEGWQEQAYHLRVLFLSDPDTPIDQLDVYSSYFATFPWVQAGTSVQFVDINGQPGAASSSGGLVTVSWITSDGAGVRFVHKGQWTDAVALARTVQPVTIADWNARIDGIENRSGHDVDCFYLVCDY